MASTGAESSQIGANGPRKEDCGGISAVSGGEKSLPQSAIGLLKPTSTDSRFNDLAESAPGKARLDGVKPTRTRRYLTPDEVGKLVDAAGAVLEAMRTPIYAQKLAPDGAGLVGERAVVLENDRE
jgi:hypothetical protein